VEKVIDRSRTDISISIVSHGQIALVAKLLYDLEILCRSVNFELILTLNIEEKLPFALENFHYPIKLLMNKIPAGFAANHNKAFTYSTGSFFCVMNPDIRLDINPFFTLTACLGELAAGVAAPTVIGGNGEVEDSARRFPAPSKILGKIFNKRVRPDYLIRDTVIFPDWVAGMFMIFPRSIFESLGGFDDRYFLYYEDVDICARLRLLGHEVVLCPQSKVTHHAQRTSHRSFKYMCWHLRSLVRFFMSPVYRQIRSRIQP
jgi:GT2 family glycosyltransferase